VTEVQCAQCGMPFEEESALELGAIRVERDGKVLWFCSPPCEKEYFGR